MKKWKGERGESGFRASCHIAHGARKLPRATIIAARPFFPFIIFYLYQIEFNLKYELLKVNLGIIYKCY